MTNQNSDITHFSLRKTPGERKDRDYGIVSFQKDGREYNVYGLLLGRERNNSMTVIQIPGGINVAGIDFYYPKDFKKRHLVPLPETLEYRKEQERKKINRLEKAKQRKAEKEKIKLEKAETENMELSDNLEI